MRAFDYAAPSSVDEALRLTKPGSAFLAGGTTLVDLMKLDVLTPDHVIDVNRLPLNGIRLSDGHLRIGALERMSAVAAHPTVMVHFPVISRALLLSASGQLRNMASIGGNLLQRTRCDYFRDVTAPCNKRQPGSGCPAQTGVNRTHAILGSSSSCAATHASDVAVAFVALEAMVVVRGRGGDRIVPLEDFYLLPGNTPQVENQLGPDELIVEVRVPVSPLARQSTYLKIRDRQSYEFALTSVAVALSLRRGVVLDARIAAGGVGTKPWRLRAVEDALKGNPAMEKTFSDAAESAVDGARPLAQNAFKVTLLKRTIVRALIDVAGVR
ncbi:xanthine dehydrogenase family protein subunit M [Lentzea tibetensis]|uniref:Xanthine dehydrogenase family protein subunit M n=1 Tax=Lentzea tibetensis TaxID=2591470 RepID=A0A563EKX7_9PSEU|nr:xanthine dehydrogenase family protein subunit M [Lentzea tibetensis]TWP47792.1 xanthine dehydrogenase family protein subunit M [Lentzea tibetensis]